MRFALWTVVTLTVIGCSRESAQYLPAAPGPVPPAPSSPSPTSTPRLTSLAVVVIEERGGGGCIQGATVEVVRGQALGQSVRQATLCSVWDPDPFAYFPGLTEGVEMTL